MSDQKNTYETAPMPYSNIYNPPPPAPHYAPPPHYAHHHAPPQYYAPQQYMPYPPVRQERKPASAPEPRYEWRLSDYDEYDADKSPKQRKRGGGFVIFAVCMLFMVALGIAGVTALNLLDTAEPPASPVSAPAAAPESTAPAPDGQPRDSVQIQFGARPPVHNTPLPEGRLSIPDVAELVKPSVVSVVKYMEQLIEPVGIGSGIILSENGYIVTNAHVVQDGTDFKVYIYSGDPYDARLIGMDLATDLAVLKIDADGLTPAVFGDSAALRVGETVIAIGNPVNLNFAGSVTQGIVSALDRRVDLNRHAIDYIQTDAAINPGHSGGALVNEYGQVIGINVAKITAAGYEGMCFAIPSTAALPVIEDLIMHGRVTGRVKIGITGEHVDELDARRNALKPGVMIRSIDDDSDLIGKNIQRQDIITHINGERVLVIPDIHAILDGLGVGDTITLTIFRKTLRSDIEFDLEIMLVEDMSGYAPQPQPLP
ncbi:MAG: trypsin-like peptidase domain-containing protein [Oscillospiraceae bacterium]|nr:trypsin-like peptidase domain-containing protein [Oscillospiraceae bacterium]